MDGQDAVRTAPGGPPASPADREAPDLGLYRVLREDGTPEPGAEPERMPRELCVRAYREIKRLRLLDARMILIQRQGRRILP